LNLVDVFRCSADVEQHPRKLLVSVLPDAKEYAETLIREAAFTNTGPLIAVQAGASQGKRQWAPAKFTEMIKILLEEYNARVIMTGSSKEQSIVQPIMDACASPNVFSAVGRTSIPQIAALLNLCDVLVTGDTGPMHISVAAGTPVVSMFLASAYGFETGPYSAGNIVLQPVIGCGPCNPNKACSRPDCHDMISPRLMAYLAAERAKGDITSISAELADPSKVIVYRSAFDDLGFCDLVPLNKPDGDVFSRHRRTYRKLWLDDLGGFVQPESDTTATRRSPLQVVDSGLEGLSDLASCATKGQRLMRDLAGLISDVRSPASKLTSISTEIVELDRKIEELGYHYSPFGALTRMFVFAKENLKGSDPAALASQMDGIYRDLGRRCEKFRDFYQRS